MRPPPPDWQELFERLERYPQQIELIVPTRLGNALRAMETYGSNRYGLDSQTLWYELQSTTSPTLRTDLEDNRASVDFFVSAVAHLSLLAVVSTGVAIACHGGHSIAPAVVAVVSVALTRPSYLAAVRNVGDWHYSIRALVNLGRGDLAHALGLRLPQSFAEERRLWSAVTDFVSYGPRDEYLRFLNVYRRRF
jgi:hypothetical protein